METHFEHAITDNCINPDSQGVICVYCNGCGRIDKSTQKESALKVYRKILNNKITFNEWFNDNESRKRQEKNIKANIEFYKKKIAELEGEE